MILNIIMVVFYTKSGSVVMAKGGSVIVARLQNTGSVIVAHNNTITLGKTELTVASIIKTPRQAIQKQESLPWHH
jgi:hypothetical protein